MDIRHATATDCSAIARIQVRGWQAAYADILPSDYLAALSVEKRELMWREFVTRGSAELLVARDGDSIVGFVACGRCRDDGAAAGRAEIWAIYVMPSHWSQGIGTGLWGQAVQRLRALEYTSVGVWVLVKNSRAIGFYESQGFAADHGSEKEIVIGGEPVREIRYARKWAPREPGP
jgi:ribosomal protein S18 acetylase RimI-like enzyme